MLLYLSSERPSLLKFNNESTVLGDKILSLQTDDYLTLTPLNSYGESICFLPNEEFFSCPPKNTLVCDLGNGKYIHFKKQNDKGFSVIAQKNLPGINITVFNLFGTYINITTANNYQTLAIQDEIFSAEISTFTLSFKQLCLIKLFGKSFRVLITDLESGDILLDKHVSDVKITSTLNLTTNHATILSHTVIDSYIYTNNGLKLADKKVFTKKDKYTLIPKLIPFAFFEEYFVRGDCAQYLCEQMKPHAEKLSSYLKEVIGVFPPPKELDCNAVALLYKKSENNYFVKYFTASVNENGKITNISPFQYKNGE